MAPGRNDDNSNENKRKSNGGRLSIWVQKLEKINTNLDDNQGQSSDNRRATEDGDDDELCFKISSLITELVLIIFAVCLLLIALVVIVSKRVPAFMDHYEIVPMVLFILCIGLAVFSFVRWLAVKIMRPLDRRCQRQRRRHGHQSTIRQQTETTRPKSSNYNDSKNTPRLVVINSPPTISSGNQLQQQDNQRPTAEKTQSHQH